MNKTLTYIAIASAICGVACSKGHDTASEQSESVDVALPVVDSVTLYKTYPGSLIADREVKLVARVNGYLESKNYQSGDFVKKGTVPLSAPAVPSLPPRQTYNTPKHATKPWPKP